MRCSVITVGFGLLSAMLFGGCISDRAAKEIGDAIASPLNDLAQQMSGARDLAYATSAFGRKNHRWPRDYSELSTFVQNTDGLLVLRHYDRVDFAQTPTGGLAVWAVVEGQTNQMTFPPLDREVRE